MTDTTLALSERLWVYNIFWACPALTAVAALLTTHWQQHPSILGAFFDVAVVLLYTLSAAWFVCAFFSRSDDVGNVPSWAARKRLARTTRPYRSRATRRKGYTVAALPGNKVEVTALGRLNDRSVPHLWPLSLGYDEARHGRLETRTFRDDQEDAIIEHIDRLRADAGTEPVDTRTAALARALNA